MNYKIAWAQYQGSEAAVEHINEIKQQQLKTKKVIDKAMDYFEYWKSMSKERLDHIGEQFPEFVNQMQSRLANRVLLYTEIKGLESQMAQGMMSDELAGEMKEELMQAIYAIRERPDTHIAITRLDVFRQNKILANIPQEEFNTISQHFNTVIVPLGETLIDEGQSSRSMYFISRGVIRLSKSIKGQPVDIATLLAGDYFGMVTVEKAAPYPVSCTAVTPCALAQLNLKSLKKILPHCPVFHKALQQAIKSRLLKM